MDDLKELFLSLDDEEFSVLIENTDAPADKELAENIKARLAPVIENNEATVRRFSFTRILPVAAAFCIVIAATLVFALNQPDAPITTTAQTTEPTTVILAPPPEENPLMVAISNGNDDLVANLLTLPGLLSQDTLEFALGFSDLLSYETISKIAESVNNLLGSTGLDTLLECVILGDSEKALEELKKRDAMLMTPFEKLSFFFAVAFCDSEVVDAFVSRGYDIHITDSKGNSIYAIAEKYGNEENMQYAVSMGITA